MSVAESQLEASRDQRPRKRFWFRFLGVLLPFVLVVMANLLLYFGGAGVDTSLVVRQTGNSGDTFHFNLRADVPYCSTDLRGPEPRGFVLPKPVGLFRVVVVGASSVQGYPFPSELSFPHQMELVLSRQMEGAAVEVLNAGIIGLSTGPLVDVVRQSIGVEPDVIVFYEGHNEFYGVGGVSTNATISPLGIEARRYRLVQCLSDLFSSTDTPGSELISRLPRQLEIPKASPLFAAAERRYAENLTAIRDLCERMRVPLILCSVVSNLRDQSPLVVTPAGSANHGSVEILTPAATRAIEPAEDVTARQRLEDAIAFEPDNAVAHYRLAQCWERAGDFPKARQEFALARDHDQCRYRAPDSFREIVRRVASEYASRGTQFVDLVPVFDQATSHAAPGEDLFVEHVHFTVEGNWLVARTISEAIVSKMNGRKWNADRVPSAAERDAEIGLLVEDQIVALEMAESILENPPFNRTLDATQHRTSLQQKIQSLLKRLPGGAEQLLEQIDGKTKGNDLIDTLGRAYLGVGELEKALQLFQLGQRRRPWVSNSLVLAAVCLHQMQRDADAWTALEKSYQTTLPANQSVIEIRNDLARRLPQSARKASAKK